MLYHIIAALMVMLTVQNWWIIYFRVEIEPEVLDFKSAF